MALYQRAAPTPFRNLFRIVQTPHAVRPDSYSGPEVPFADITILFPEPRFWPMTIMRLNITL
jgi:hypothetical protein